MSTTGPIRILFAIPSLDRGGPDRVLFELMCSLDRARFAPSLMVSERAGYYLERLPADIPVEVLGGGNSLRARYPLLRALRFVRRAAPDIVFATLRMIYTLGAIAPALPRHTRLVLRQANDFTTDFAALVEKAPLKHRVSRWISKWNLRSADAVVCQSHAMERDLRGLLGARAKLHVIGNPVDIDAIARSAAAADNGLRGSPALVSVGRLAPQKGFDILLPAIARLRARHPGLHLTILGDGPDRAALEALATTLGISDAVTFGGFTNQPLPFVKHADLFVLASRYEGFPNAALEALACGTPVVLTDCPGANSEIVTNGVDGRLAATIDPDAMAGAIEAALDELPSYDRARITTRCRERYGADRIVDAYQQLFRSVTGSHAAH